MRILHTADWHLGDRLGRIDRTADLRAAVERVAELCRTEAVDVLLVAGDLFSEQSRPDGLRESISHLQATFEPFLLQGGTIVALTGNHDNETFCETLRLVMTLAAPAVGKDGDLCDVGRLYLATEPSLVRIADRAGQEVQFALMPYPMASRYLTDQRFGSVEEKHRALHAAFLQRLQDLLQNPHSRHDLPAVLGAHLHLQTVKLGNLFRMSDQESIVFQPSEIPAEFAYVALGHIHHAQSVHGQPHLRYSGSIERLDLGEQHDAKSVTIVDIGPAGLEGEPRIVPVQATPIYRVEFDDPGAVLADLADRYPDADRALVRLEFSYTPGVDNLERILRTLDETFPRWYERDWKDRLAPGPALSTEGSVHGKNFHDTVVDYLQQELMQHDEAFRAAVLCRVEALISEAAT